ncbi:tRNA(Ile)-lysidine synthase [Parasphingorhabdus marina DSM 22363]|uniref:tRNA(Ile)-lysidine synthase n=1 Tax=Parasphingorhabdus marina DSM 22363 TaxID=1123272 RepID=A0A1N6H9B0_9SPHN|nr:tRNA lysidine(34) synthetase TilS [Parasphingorhabdus marina]SIO16285.1 tRNA(Ile)-lysidine synthase [Parasphingorhabdus marina DSM 22363]
MTEVSLQDRFALALNKLLPDFADNSDRLGLAVSGGPDSLALLLLAHQHSPDRIAAASVDHGLRPEARAECKFVASLCADRGIPHEILQPAIPIRGSIQAEARKVRYTLLGGWLERHQIAWLATAHHADDQLETLVMRILRGSGLDGMSAIRSRRGHIIRPLLHLAKDELAEFVAAQGITPIDDPSNADNSFDRVRIRKALAELQGFNVSNASQSAAALDDSRTALQWAVDQQADQHLRKTGTGAVLERWDFPHEIVRRLVLKSLHLCDPALSPRGAQLERTISALQQGQTVTIGDIICKGGKKWQFSKAPSRRSS